MSSSSSSSSFSLPQFGGNHALPLAGFSGPPAPSPPIHYPNNVLRSFVFNNNKGGVGKTTLLFHVATEAAVLDPKTCVLIIDACPQANVSQILLGGGVTGEANVHNIVQAGIPRTIAAFLSAYSAYPANTNLGDFITTPRASNSKISPNVFLLCGDPWLDLVCQGLYERANQQPAINQWHPWKFIIESLRTGIDRLARASNHNWLVFIDTNPAFTMYTQIAVAAGDELVIPCTPDSASAAGIKALCALIYGANPPHALWDRWSFARQAFVNNVKLPVITQAVGNRHTIYDKHGAKAFTVLLQEMAGGLYLEYQQRPGIFNPCFAPNDFTEFCRDFTEDVRDLSTVGVVALRQGTPLQNMGATSISFTNPDNNLLQQKATVDKRQIANMSGNNADQELTVSRLRNVLLNYIARPPPNHVIPPPPLPAAVAPAPAAAPAAAP